MNKIDLRKITLFCIDGREWEKERAERYVKIIKFMMNHVDFYEIKVFTTFDLNITGIKNHIISPMGISEYSNFCVKELNNHIDSDFCLVFQDDGFIVNPDLWDDEFYAYDYIGSPWPLYIGWPKEGFQVGNGGFSLRSKKFLEVSQKMNRTTGNEDTYILITNRKILDDNGIKIAPVEIARKFSVEIPMDESHNIYKCFGFHAKHLLNDAINYIKK